MIETLTEENNKINNLIQLIFDCNILTLDKITIGNLPGYSIIKSGINSFYGRKIYLDTASVNESGITSKEYIITMDDKPSRANMQPVPQSVWFAKLKDSPKYLLVQDYMSDLLDNFIFSTGFLGIFTENIYMANYFYALISSKQFDENKNVLSIGATMQGINNESFREILVPNTHINLMTKIGQKIDPLLRVIYTNKIKINKLADLKQLYLKKFFN